MEAVFIAIVATMFIVVAAVVFIYNQILNIKSDLLTILEREKMRDGTYTDADFEPEDDGLGFFDDFEDEDIVI